MSEVRSRVYRLAWVFPAERGSAYGTPELHQDQIFSPGSLGGSLGG